MHESTDRCSARDAFRPAVPAPGVRAVGVSAAFEDCLSEGDGLSCDGQVEGVEEAERGEIWAREVRLGLSRSFGWSV